MDLKILFIVCIGLLIFGCGVEEEIVEPVKKESTKVSWSVEDIPVEEPESELKPKPKPKPEPEPEPEFDLDVVISECDSLCEEDEGAYCEEERVIEFDGERITGTCRAFAKTSNNIDGFSKCEGYCKEYSSRTTKLVSVSL